MDAKGSPQGASYLSPGQRSGSEKPLRALPQASCLVFLPTVLFSY